MPRRMNKLDVTIEVLSDATEFDDIFREPQPGGRKFNTITIEKFAQFKNMKFEQLDYSNKINNDFISKGRLVISKEDWDEAKNRFNIELKKGSVITKVGSIEMKLVVNEIKPTGFLNGEHTIYFVELIDNNIVLGGVY